MLNWCTIPLGVPELDGDCKDSNGLSPTATQLSGIGSKAECLDACQANADTTACEWIDHGAGGGVCALFTIEAEVVTSAHNPWYPSTCWILKVTQSGCTMASRKKRAVGLETGKRR